MKATITTRVALAFSLIVVLSASAYVLLNGGATHDFSRDGEGKTLPEKTKKVRKLVVSVSDLPTELQPAAEFLGYDQWPVPTGEVVPGFVIPTDGATISSGAGWQDSWKVSYSSVEAVIWPPDVLNWNAASGQRWAKSLYESHNDGTSVSFDDLVPGTLQKVHLYDSGTRAVNVSINVYPTALDAYATLVAATTPRTPATGLSGIDPEPYEWYAARTNGVGDVSVVNEWEEGAFVGGPGSVTFIDFVRKNVRVRIKSDDFSAHGPDNNPISVVSIATWIDGLISSVATVQPEERTEMQPLVQITVDHAVIKTGHYGSADDIIQDWTGFTASLVVPTSNPCVWKPYFGAHLMRLTLSGSGSQGTLKSKGYTGEKQFAITYVDLVTGLSSIALASVIVEH